MKKKLLVLIVVMCFVVSTFSTNVFTAENISESNSEYFYDYIEYDYETQKTTRYSVPATNSIQVNETWDLFDSQAVDSMKQIAKDTIGGANSNLSRTIIGEDQRFLSSPTDAPYSSVALLIATYDTDNNGTVDDSSCGTGFLVSKNVLVTAAHCVVPKEDIDTTKLVELKIYFGVHQYGASLTGLSYEHPKKWTWTTNWHGSDGWMYDYCVIELHNDITRPYYFNCISSSNAATPQSIYASGYPGDFQYYQMTSFGQLTETAYNWCHYDNDMVPGMSGGPLYTSTNCIGIITYQADTFNQGNLFTPSLYNLICSKIVDNQ